MKKYNKKTRIINQIRKSIKNIFFNKNGSLIDLIPKLKAELLKNERKKYISKKIEIDDLVFKSII